MASLRAFWQRARCEACFLLRRHERTEGLREGFVFFLWTVCGQLKEKRIVVAAGAWTDAMRSRVWHGDALLVGKRVKWTVHLAGPNRLALAAHQHSPLRYHIVDQVRCGMLLESAREIQKKKHRKSGSSACAPQIFGVSSWICFSQSNAQDNVRRANQILGIICRRLRSERCGVEAQDEFRIANPRLGIVVEGSDPTVRSSLKDQLNWTIFASSKERTESNDDLDALDRLTDPF